MTSAAAAFAIRVVSVDAYSAPVDDPHPVIRVFGVTPSGRKCTCHVHGVYPYFYIPADAAAVAADPGGLCRHVHDDLERRLGRARSVLLVRAVRGTSFYGFHGDADIAPEVAGGHAKRSSGPSQVFFQIFLRSPTLLGRAASLLQAAGHQPFESHIPFLLQFYVDYAVNGMSLLLARSARFRPPLRRSPSIPLQQHTLRSRVGLSPCGTRTEIDVRSDVTACMRASAEIFQKLREPPSHGASHEDHIIAGTATAAKQAQVVPVATDQAVFPERLNVALYGVSAWPHGLRPLSSEARGSRGRGTPASRSCTTELECDVDAEDICNPGIRDTLRAAALEAAQAVRLARQAGLPEPLQPPEATFSSVLSLAPLWAEERARRAAAGGASASQPAWRAVATSALSCKAESTNDAAVALETAPLINARGASFFAARGEVDAMYECMLARIVEEEDRSRVVGRGIEPADPLLEAWVARLPLAASLREKRPTDEGPLQPLVRAGGCPIPHTIASPVALAEASALPDIAPSVAELPAAELREDKGGGESRTEDGSDSGSGSSSSTSSGGDHGEVGPITSPLPPLHYSGRRLSGAVKSVRFTQRAAAREAEALVRWADIAAAHLDAEGAVPVREGDAGPEVPDEIVAVVLASQHARGQHGVVASKLIERHRAAISDSQDPVPLSIGGHIHRGELLAGVLGRRRQGALHVGRSVGNGTGGSALRRAVTFGDSEHASRRRSSFVGGVAQATGASPWPESPADFALPLATQGPVFVGRSAQHSSSQPSAEVLIAAPTPAIVTPLVASRLDTADDPTQELCDDTPPSSPHRLLRTTVVFPTASQLAATLAALGLPAVLCKQPHFSDEADVPRDGVSIISGLTFQLRGVAPKTLQEFEPPLLSRSRDGEGPAAALKAALQHEFGYLPAVVRNTNFRAGEGGWTETDAASPFDDDDDMASPASLGGWNGVPLESAPGRVDAQIAHAAQSVADGRVVDLCSPPASYPSAPVNNDTDAPLAVSRVYRGLDYYARLARGNRRTVDISEANQESASCFQSDLAGALEIMSSAASLTQVSSTPAVFVSEQLGAQAAANAVEEQPHLLLDRFRARQLRWGDLLPLQKHACATNGHVSGDAPPHADSLPVDAVLPCSRLVLRWGEAMLSPRDARKWLLRHPPVVGCAAEGSFVGLACPRREADADTQRSGAATTAGTATPSQASHLQAHGLRSQISPTQLQRRKKGAPVGFKRGGPAPPPPPLPPLSSPPIGEGAAPSSSDLPQPVHAAAVIVPDNRGSHELVAEAAASAETPPPDAAAAMVAPPVPQLEQHQRLTVLSLEAFSLNRGQLLPDPAFDSLLAVAWAVHDDDIALHRRVLGGERRSADFRDALVVGVILVAPAVPGGEARLPQRGASFDCSATERLALGLGLGPRVLVAPVNSEADLLWAVAALVREWDADILVGYDIERESLGLMLARAVALRIPLAQALSRCPGDPAPYELANQQQPQQQSRWRARSGSVQVTGRIILNTWRIMRGELKLGIYTLQSVAQHVLRATVPAFPPAVLTQWWSGGPATRWRVCEHLVDRAALTLHILDALDIVGRTSESARLYGIDFASVLSRGSQYRVEAVGCRAAKPLGYVLPSPSRPQVAAQPAMECIPLVMEPQSRVYSSPVIVLDFQSLYPSLVIAYNLCFCTILGRLRLDAEGGHLRSQLGIIAGGFAPPPGVLSQGYVGGVGAATAVRRQERGPLETLTDEDRPSRPTSLFVAPNGAVFAPPSLRTGVLPRMLQEILDTRVMVKAAAARPDVAGDPVMRRVMTARQLALKMIANVTYGYTAAGFSGRMPCADLADAIVSAGRSTLQRAIALVEGRPAWGARVVYGDTDSLFVNVPGRSVAEAFRIGAEIAAQVNARNPRPVTLKLEKVYERCVLVTKKRYVGLTHEKPPPPPGSGIEGPPPALDCKGLEMVRRDTCPLVAQLMEKTLRVMLGGGGCGGGGGMDLSALRARLVRAWGKMLEGRVSPQEYTFAMEVRLGSYRSDATAPPAAVVARAAMAADPRAVPARGERVRFVVVTGERGAKLRDLAVDPLALLRRPDLYRLNQTYYIEKQIIPALGRIYSLCGADLGAWFREMRQPANRRLLAVRPPQALLLQPAAARGSCPGCSGSHAGATRGGLDGGEHLPPHYADEALRAPESTNAAAAGAAAAAVALPWQPPRGGGGARGGVQAITAYYGRAACELCGGESGSSSGGGGGEGRALCATCRTDPQRAEYILLQRHSGAERTLAELRRLCASCTRIPDASDRGAAACASLDCPVFFARFKAAGELQRIHEVLAEVGLA